MRVKLLRDDEDATVRLVYPSTAAEYDEALRDARRAGRSGRGPAVRTGQAAPTW